MPHIVSKMTHDVKYTLWQSNPGGINIPKSHVLVKGGHGVARRDATGGLFTPNGVVTHVTDEQLAVLEADETFKTHLANRVVTIVKSEPAPKKVQTITADMGESPDRPLTDADAQKGGRMSIPDDMKVNRGKKLQ